MVPAETRRLIEEAYQAGSLLVQSVSPDTSVVSWSPVTTVVRHESGSKRMLEVSVEGTICTVTEDHSLFLLVDGKIQEVPTMNIKVGDSLAVVTDGILTYATVTSVAEAETCQYAYDISVPGDENFVLTSGILAHNTYSVSGVSLDLEKSSKYMSMKENWEQNFDKMLERVKNSIKIVKGLQQPRYGIGISSALGPFSRVGVQSRRNYVGSGGGYWT